jgi:hypothetical protein
MARRKSPAVERVTLRANGKEVTLTGDVTAKIDAAIDRLEQKEQEKTSRKAKRSADLADTNLLDTLGPGLWVPTKWRPHLVAARKKAKEKLADKHGVSLRRVGDDCLVEAGNGVCSISILLEGEGAHAPAARTVIPARAWKTIAAAAAEEIELAQLWFQGARVIVCVGEEYHQFRTIQPDLPFPAESLREMETGPSVYDLVIDAGHLTALQRALNAPTVGVNRCGKGVVVIYPEGENTSLAMGFLATCGDGRD